MTTFDLSMPIALASIVGGLHYKDTGQSNLLLTAKCPANVEEVGTVTMDVSIRECRPNSSQEQFGLLTVLRVPGDVSLDIELPSRLFAPLLNFRLQQSQGAMLLHGVSEKLIVPVQFPGPMLKVLSVAYSLSSGPAG